jgi:23S rRNA (adenine2503-C2)-methyltransferase
MDKITKNIQVPTGNICIMQGEKGKLEFLSIGDYGKQANIKADFLGIERELNGVPNGDIMPLTEKWVVTVSTQYGCSMNCKFCDVPKVGKGLNATSFDLHHEIISALKLHPEIKYTKRLNIHYARMGEPTWNLAVLDNARHLPDIVEPYIGHSLIHPVISTMMPKANKNLFGFLLNWCEIKNGQYDGNAGLQFSINSTDDAQREYLFSGNAMTLKEISEMAKDLPNPNGRKYALNFALADNSIIDEHVLISLFPADKFMCKITPLHDTKSCEENDLKTTGGYRSFTPYKDVETRLKSVGYDVIVFIPSYDEDHGLITCGNAILSGNLPTTDYQLIK